MNTTLPRSGSAYAVRPPAPGDFERMAQLAAQLGYPCRPEDVANRLREMRDSRQHAVFVAQRDDGQIVGWIGTHIFRSVVLDAIAEISGLVVDEDSRSRGVGRRLLDAAEEWARSVGNTALWVRSNAVRGRAHRFYRSNGYEQIKIQKVFRKILDGG
jgi:GNAT superfamily N-acetyltransferase